MHGVKKLGEAISVTCIMGNYVTGLSKVQEVQELHIWLLQIWPTWLSWPSWLSKSDKTWPCYLANSGRFILSELHPWHTEAGPQRDVAVDKALSTDYIYATQKIFCWICSTDGYCWPHPWNYCGKGLTFALCLFHKSLCRIIDIVDRHSYDWPSTCYGTTYTALIGDFNLHPKVYLLDTPQ